MTSSIGGASLGYRPALDGVRAVSIALVLAFHLGAPWMEGGYLGVSVFFTLSGFLITSLLLAERSTTGGIDVRSFYVRRLRRLLPASLLCIGGIALLAAAGVVAARDDLRSGMFGAAFQVANWERLLGDESYADLFAAPSPVDHFWSLAIEEQFYWVWPLVVAGLTALAPRHIARWLVGVFVMFGVAGFATARVLGGDAAYFASWSRFAEILAGAALAALVAGRTVSPRWGRVALPALLAIVALSVVTPAGRGWAYEGGLPVFSVLSALLVVGAFAGGPVARLLSLEPIPWVGRISYGLYLYHWPVFTVLDDAPVLGKLAATLAISVVSYYGIERPIRTGRWWPARSRFLGSAALGVASVTAAIAVVVPAFVEHAPRSPEPVVLAAVDTAPIVDAEGPPAATARATAVTAPPSTVVVFGDSVADWMLRDATPSFARADVTLVDAAIEGCDGAEGEPPARHRSGAPMPPPPGCDVWTVTYPPVVDAAGGIDVAVLMVGNRPLVDHQIDGEWVSPCDELDWYVTDLENRIAWLQANAGKVVVVLPAWGGRGLGFFATDDHRERMACVRDAMEAVVSAAGVGVLDLAAVLCPDPATGCPPLREDGLHIDADKAPFVLEWLLDGALDL